MKKSSIKIITIISVIALLLCIGGVSFAAWRGSEASELFAEGRTGQINAVNGVTVIPAAGTYTTDENGIHMDKLYPVDHIGDGLLYYTFKLKADVIGDVDVKFTVKGSVSDSNGNVMPDSDAALYFTMSEVDPQNPIGTHFSDSVCKIGKGDENNEIDVFVYMMAYSAKAMDAHIFLTFGASAMFMLSGSTDMGATVTLSDGSGNSVETAEAVDGNFAFDVDDGENYNLTAVTDTRVSAAKSVSINANDLDIGNLAVDKPKITTQIDPEHTLQPIYNAATGNYESMWGEFVNGYFADAEIDANGNFALYCELGNWSEEHKPYYPRGGVQIGTTAGGIYKSAWFAIMYNPQKGRYVMQFSCDHNGVKELDVLHELDITEYNTKIKLVLIFNNGKIYPFIDDSRVTSFKMYTPQPYFTEVADADVPFGSQKLNIGLTANHAVDFTDWGIITDRSELLEYSEIIGSISLPADFEATVNGQSDDGTRVMLGDSVTVTAPTDDSNIAILVDGHQIVDRYVDGEISGSFAVKSVSAIAVTIVEKYAVSGTLDFTADKIGVYGETGVKLYETSGNSFAVDLAEGNYYVTASSSTLVSMRTPFSVVPGESNVISVTQSPKATGSNGTLNGNTVYTMEYDDDTGYYKPKTESVGMFCDVTVDNESEWVFETVLYDLIRTDDDEKRSHVGIILGTSWDKYLRFSIKRRIDADRIYFNEVFGESGQIKYVWRDKEKYFGDDRKGDCKMALVCSNGKLYLFLNGNLEAELTTEITETSIFGETRVGVYAGQSVTVKDWYYNTDISEYESKLN